MTILALNIAGMTCGGCVNSVKRALAAVPGVQQADVSLTPGQATVHYDPTQVSPAQLQSAIEEAGFAVIA